MSELNLEDVRFHELVISPDVGAIYFLFANKQLQYVGKSMSLLQRIKSHHANKTFDSVKFIHVPKAAIDRYEIAFIKHLKPPLNKTKHSAITEDESQLIRPYTDRDFFHLQALDKLKIPKTYGAVCFYEYDGNIDFFDDPDLDAKLCFGHYDDDESREHDDHNESCPARPIFESLMKVYDKFVKIPDEALERTCELCTCEDYAIVYANGERDTYHVVERWKLRSAKGLSSLEYYKDILKENDLSFLRGFGFKGESLDEYVKPDLSQVAVGE